MSQRGELTLTDGRRFAFAIKGGVFVCLHRVYARPTLVGGEWLDIFDNYRSISANDKRRASIEAAIRAELTKVQS